MSLSVLFVFVCTIVVFLKMLMVFNVVLMCLNLFEFVLLIFVMFKFNGIWHIPCSCEIIEVNFARRCSMYTLIDDNW